MVDSTARKAGRGQPQRCLATTLTWDLGVASGEDIGLRKVEGLVQLFTTRGEVLLRNSPRNSGTNFRNSLSQFGAGARSRARRNSGTTGRKSRTRKSQFRACGCRLQLRPSPSLLTDPTRFKFHKFTNSPTRVTPLGA